MFKIKLFFQNFILSSFLFLSFSVLADSPLTSISFWDNSQSALVQKTGKQKGRKKLNNVRFKFFMDSNTTIFDKMAMVNALGWDINSKFNNSQIFLNKLKKEYRKQLLNTPPFSLENVKFDDNLTFEINDNYLVYLYLLAMDNYRDASSLNEVLDSLEEVEYLLPYNEEYDNEGEVIGYNNNNIDSKEVFGFIKMLVSAQYLFLTKGINCEVWEKSNNYIYSDYSFYTPNFFIKKSLLKSYDYLKNYSNDCEVISYDINKTYGYRKVIHANQNQKVWILHYPLFIYGKLTIYDLNNEVFKFNIDGDDYVGLDISNYPKGRYRIEIINSETEPKTPFNLELIIY